MSLLLDVLILNAGILEPISLEDRGNLGWQQVRNTLTRSPTP